MAEVKDYSEYIDKRVTLTVKDPADGEGSLEIEGRIEAASTVGMVFRRKGTSASEVFMLDDVLGVEMSVETKKIKPRYIKEIELGNVRQHLADRHGFLLKNINAITEEEAVLVHDDHHKEHGVELGHVHGEKPKRPSTPREDAIEAASAEQADPSDEDDGAF